MEFYLYIYFNAQDRAKYDIAVQYMQGEYLEDFIGNYTVPDVPMPDGYTILFHREVERLVAGIVATDGDDSFLLYLGHISPTSAQHGLSIAGVRMLQTDESAFISLVEDMKFEEFLENWRMYTG
jgi:hypothetical protein